MTQYGEGMLDPMVLAATKEVAAVKYLNWEGKSGKSQESMARCLGLTPGEAKAVFKIFVAKGLMVEESPGYKSPNRFYAPEHAPSNRRKSEPGAESSIKFETDLGAIDPVLAKRREIQTQNQLLYGRRTTGKSWGQSA
jgi:hypothetical protein